MLIELKFKNKYDKESRITLNTEHISAMIEEPNNSTMIYLNGNTESRIIVPVSYNDMVKYVLNGTYESADNNGE